MAEAPRTATVIRFGVYEADMQAGELRKNGVKIRIQEQPFQVLVTLLERPGEVVTREELREKLWPDHTFVDFDQGLNTAINKIREALGDSASNPRFVETVPRRGYRFIAPVELPEGWEPVTVERAGDRPSWRPGLLTVAVILVAAILGVAIGYWMRSPGARPALRLVRFSISPEAEAVEPVISPNGRHIAYVTDGALWIHDLDRGQSRRIEGTDGAIYAFWSPDSGYVGFCAAEEVRKVPVSGGPITTICRGGNHGRAVWSPDGGTIVFTGGEPNRLFEVPAVGGDRRLLVDPAEFKEGASFYFPSFLPVAGTERYLLVAMGGWTETRIFLFDLEGGHRSELEIGTRPTFSPTGHIVFQKSAQSEGLWALPFSMESFEPTGEAFRVTEDGMAPSIATDGTLVYLGGRSGLWGGPHQLVWRDRAGHLLGEIGSQQETIESPAISPNGRFIAAAIRTNSNNDIWTYDLDRGGMTRLTFASAPEFFPVWSPDGREIAFTWRRGGNGDIYVVPSNGNGAPRPIAATAFAEFSGSWSPDGTCFLYHFSDEESQLDIWYLLREGDGTEFKAVPFLKEPSVQKLPRLSPDGRHVAYVSDESGTFEIYVRPFPSGAGKWQISYNGGAQPVWSKNGEELFYVEEDSLMAVPVETTPTFSAGQATKLFADPGLTTQMTEAPQYDISADGQRFLLREVVGKAPTPIWVVQNWHAEFRNRQ